MHQSSHIVGMSSLMLYEAWLWGVPSFRFSRVSGISVYVRLKERSGLVFHDKCDDISVSMKRWLGTMPGAPRRELAQHEQAAACILEMAMKRHRQKGRRVGMTEMAHIKQQLAINGGVKVRSNRSRPM